MAHAARALLESALRERQLDRTLTTSLPTQVRHAAAGCTPTGVAALDDCLGGGLPRGQFSEIVGARSSGRTALACQVLAAATQREDRVALVDVSDRLDVASALAAGIDLSRLLWVRGTCDGSGTGAAAIDRALERAIKALNLIVQAGGFGIIAIDLADVPAPALRRLPPATWLRLQRAIAGSETVGLVLAATSMARGAGGLTLACAGQVAWNGTSARDRYVGGIEVRVQVVSSRWREQATVTVGARHPDTGSAHAAGW